NNPSPRPSKKPVLNFICRRKMVYVPVTGLPKQFFILFHGERTIIYHAKEYPILLSWKGVRGKPFLGTNPEGL
ncbi:MAG: hypothetical protein IJE17_08130, partial [Clostridia bacterium]|nr:hypothetical protein [Clostridia bacterium]